MSQSELPGGSIGYYKTRDDTDVTGGSTDVVDPEHLEYKVCNRGEAEELFEEFKAKVLTSQQVKLTLDEVIDKLLQQLDCSVDEERSACKKKSRKFHIDSDVRLPHSSQKKQSCGVCLNQPTQMYTASCGHTYCNGCWSSYIETQLSYSLHSDIECMDKDCNVILTEDMVLAHLTQTQTKEKYLRFVFTSYVNMHPYMRFCPSPDCSAIIYAREKTEREVTFTDCKKSFCFACGTDYHAPTSCENIQKWLEKCSDNSESDNYLLAYTKKCPNCKIHIEKDGGCEYIYCLCGTDFCWNCGDVPLSPEECNCYGNDPPPRIAEETEKLAEENLSKYLDCFEQWNYHAKSLKLEADESQKLKEKIQCFLLTNKGVQIPWEYVVDATELLKRCRHTLQYTYPYLYYLKNGDPHKQKFMILQGELEANVKKLSQVVRKPEITDRGGSEYWMNLAERARQDLLKETERNAEYISTDCEEM